MPLVDYNHDLAVVGLVYCPEYVFVSLVHEYLLYLREEDSCILDVPVYQMLIQALLSKGLWSSLMNLLSVAEQFVSPWSQHVLVPLHQVMRQVKPGFMVKPLPSSGIKFRAQEVQFSPLFFSFLTSKLYL